MKPFKQCSTRRLPVPVEIPTVPRRPIVQHPPPDFLYDLHNQSYLPSCWTKPIEIIRDRPPIAHVQKRIKNMPKSVSSESEDEPLTTVKKLKKFSQVTTAHGFAKIASSKTCCGKLSWSILIFFCIFMFITQTSWTVSKYRKNEKLVKTKTIYESALFPAVTVCNLNPFKRSFAKQTPKIRRTVDAFEKAAYGSAKRHQAKEKLIISLASLPEEERVMLSNEKLELIELCSIDGRDCNIENDFKLTTDPVFGNCYTFNADTRNLTSTRPGSEYGLRMLLNLNTGDFVKTSESAGFRISIHGKTQHPFPDSHGHSASVGFLSSFSIKRRVVHRISTSTDVCTKNGKNEKYIYPDYDYQTEGCQRSCVQRTLMEICSCSDPRLPIPRNGVLCSATNDTFLRECMKTTLFKMGELKHKHRILNDCGCQQPCDEEIYDVTASFAQWPSLPSTIDNCYDPNPDECFKHYKRHAALVEVYFQQMGYESVVETKVYGKCPFEFADLIADFGGLLGLWTGISLMTCIEFLILFWDVIVVALFCKKKQNNCSSNSSTRRKSASNNAFDIDPIQLSHRDYQVSAF